MARGTIINRGTKEDPNYSVVLEGDRDPVTGKRRQHWYSGYKSSKEAEQARTKLLHQMDTGRYVEPSKLTVKDFFAEWLEAIDGTVRDSTKQTYSLLVRVHITPNLGSIRLQRLGPAHLNTLYKKLRTEGKTSQRPLQKRKAALKSGKTPVEEGSEQESKQGLSDKSVRNIHIVIHKAFDYAVAQGLVQKNVADSANAPKPARSSGREMKTWDTAQVNQFLGGIEEHRHYPAFLLAATTGMRRGEVLGLRWEDVNFERSEVTVRQALTTTGYEVSVSLPKTPKSRRCINLDPKTAAVLKALKARQAAEQLSKGPGYVATGLVFTREDGNLVHPDRLSNLFDRLVKKSKLPRIRLHDLRHTYATIALQKNVNIKVLSERLGHSSVAFTMDVYQHVLPGMQEEAANAVAAAIFGD